MGFFNIFIFIFFSTQFNNNNNLLNPWVQPDPTWPMWIGLGLVEFMHVVGWVRLNFFWPIMVGWVKKFPQPDPCTPLHIGTPLNSKWFSSWVLSQLCYINHSNYIYIYIYIYYNKLKCSIYCYYTFDFC